MTCRIPAVLLAGVLVLVTGCGDDDGGDLGAFCDAVRTLQEDDPFAELDIASPDELRTAFDDLRDGAEDIASNAPDEARARAGDYLDSVETLIDELRAAGYDPRSLDVLAYRSAADDYEAAAVSVERAAAATCP